MSDDRLHWIFETGDDAQLAARYDAWAAEYDRDHDDWGWVGPVKAVDRLLAHANPVAILDAGCGTGGVGRALRAAAWAGELIGVDLSSGMLARAEAGGWYGELVHASLTALPLGDGSVDAYVATGVYTHGHVGPEGFAEALRVVRPGGAVVLTVRAEIWDALEPEATRLEVAGEWELVERTEPASFHPGKGDQDDKPQSVVTWRRR
ncbi:MAG: methyltransferase domain-containing protein [Actinomycetota bacterium]